LMLSFYSFYGANVKVKFASFRIKV
jgi:hypothetical protein